jgi:two-component system, OmpR family, sensor kinase
VMVLVLVGAGAFVYLRLDSDLTDSVDDTLEVRAQSILAGAAGGDHEPNASRGAPGEREDGFSQVIGGNGQVVSASGGVLPIGADLEPVPTAEERAQARTGPVHFERDVAGVDGTARVLAVALPVEGRTYTIVVGQSLEDRDETLASLVASFAIGGPIAVVLASLLGYALASAGFRPVEAMRERARRVSFEEGADPLPLPAARDEIRRLGETLNEMLARLRASFDRERRFVADASHELRSPIAVIKAELDNALRAAGPGAQTRESLVSASEECDRLAQLADDLLVLARSSEGELPVHRETVVVRTTLDDALTRFAARAAERGREIRVELDGDPIIYADALRLRQALSNLVDNALRHGDGAVTLRARAVGGWVEIDVADEGPGFAPALADRAFERFARGDAARGRGGAGLGLAIARAICEAHGGSAEIVPGPGATLRLRLPAADARLSGSSQSGVVGFSQRSTTSKE